ncbi:hypothetical protein ColTof3_12892 [Colletotrichum tofieldiae]|nr:hypothetical protein ColTof3_12892 [Colletotrichum tofieldiae]GKT93824.1 hypothetical protein Ct61P_11674 [Colletotrichum tofieldiae]
MTWVGVSPAPPLGRDRRALLPVTAVTVPVWNWRLGQPGDVVAVGLQWDKKLGNLPAVRVRDPDVHRTALDTHMIRAL